MGRARMTSSVVRALAPSLVLLALVACQPEEPEPPPPPVDPCADFDQLDPALDIGTADSMQSPFTEFADGDVMRVVAGAQGSFHVYLHLRAHGICPADAILRTTILEEVGGARVSTWEAKVDLV